MSKKMSEHHFSILMLQIVRQTLSPTLSQKVLNPIILKPTKARLLEFRKIIRRNLLFEILMKGSPLGPEM